MFPVKVHSPIFTFALKIDSSTLRSVPRMESLHILYVWGFWSGKKVFCRELLPGGFFSAEIFYSTSYVTMMMIAFGFQLSINYILMQ